jgi:hypothetical protein
LATFDRGLRTLAAQAFDAALEIVPTRWLDTTQHDGKNKGPGEMPGPLRLQENDRRAHRCYGVMIVEPVAVRLVDVVMVTVTVNGPLPATYVRVC